MVYQNRFFSFNSRVRHQSALFKGLLSNYFINMTQLMIMQMVAKMMKGVSTSISNMICDFVGINQEELFVLKGYRISTQTVILELKGINFNDFHINVRQMQKNIQILMKSSSSAIPRRLIQMKSKKFELQINWMTKEVFCQEYRVSVKREMNSSIEF